MKTPESTILKLIKSTLVIVLLAITAPGAKAQWGGVIFGNDSGNMVLEPSGAPAADFMVTVSCSGAFGAHSTPGSGGAYWMGFASLPPYYPGEWVFLQLTAWSPSWYSSYEAAVNSGDPTVRVYQGGSYVMLGDGWSWQTPTTGGFRLQSVAPPTGSLQVNISPAGAVSAGAQWRVDGGAWRASGTTVSGLSTGSHTVNFSTVSGWPTPVDQTASISANVTTILTGVYQLLPEIAVEQPSGTNLADGGSRSFGSANIGTNASPVSFTVRNSGTADLTGLAITKDGSHAADFSVGALGATTLAPGASTTFTVTFAPTASGTRTAAIHIASNDTDENPFDITLSGTGIVPAPEIAVEQPAGTGLVDGSSGVDLGSVAIGANAVKSFTVKNLGTADLTGLAFSKDGTHAGDFSLGSLGAATLAPGASTTFTVTFAPTASGPRTAAIHIASNDADENPFDIILNGNFAVADAIDLPGFSISNGGTAPWFPQASTTHDGIDAAQSGDIGDSQTSSFSLTATGPGNVSFWWKVSSEGSYDYLRFYIDGVEQTGKISGTVDWQQKSFSLAAGSHTLQWSFSKDGSVSSGSDCGWVDQVVLPDPVSTWLLGNGFAADSNLLADPNGDGVNLLMAYALNMDPKLNLSGSLPKPVIVGNQMSLTYYAGKDGVTYTVQTSIDLQNWSTDGVAFSAPDANKFRTATVGMSGPCRYMRLVVVR